MTPGRSTNAEGNLQTPAWRAPREKQETQTDNTGTPENANVERPTLEPEDTKPPALAPLRASQAACRPDCHNAAEVPSFTLRTALQAITFVSDLCGVDVQRFQERSSQALPNSKELSV